MYHTVSEFCVCIYIYTYCICIYEYAVCKDNLEHIYHLLTVLFKFIIEVSDTAQVMKAKCPLMSHFIYPLGVEATTFPG